MKKEVSENLEKICVEAYTPLSTFFKTDTPIYRCGKMKSYCLTPENWRACQYHKDYEINKLIGGGQ